MSLKETCCDYSAYEEKIADKNIRIFTPNIITSNNDGVNDFFIYSAAFIENPSMNEPMVPTFATVKLKIFKRNNSKLVFESTNYKNEFIGKDSKGSLLDEGKYRYELTLDNNFVKGSLCIIRNKSICTSNCILSNPNDQLLLNMSCD
jgi:hypothetical protein